jgi:hypothetical protein
MADRDRPPLVIQDGRLVYCNFSGVSQRFNEEGNRNFCVILDDKSAKAMEKDGWNVKWQPPREEGDPLRPILKVNVRYRRRDGTKTRPPRIVLIGSRGKTEINEEMIPLLDWADIVSADMILRPYEYDPGKFSAYLNMLYVTIRENELELKYLDVPDAESAQSVILDDSKAPF